MTITFTKHALTRLNQRSISEREILDAIISPDIITLENETERKYAIYKHINGYSLKVVYIESDVEKRIVTVFKIKKLRVNKLKNVLIEGE